LHQPLLQNLVWSRAAGDTIFAAGVVGIAMFVIGLATGRLCEKSSAATAMCSLIKRWREAFARSDAYTHPRVM